MYNNDMNNNQNFNGNVRPLFENDFNNYSVVLFRQAAKRQLKTEG